MASRPINVVSFYDQADRIGAAAGRRSDSGSTPVLRAALVSAATAKSISAELWAAVKLMRKRGAFIGTAG